MSTERGTGDAAGFDKWAVSPPHSGVLKCDICGCWIEGQSYKVQDSNVGISRWMEMCPGCYREWQVRGACG